MARRLGRWGIGVVLVGGIVLFTGNGWTDPWLWAYVLTLALVSLYALASIDDDLAKERFSPPEPSADRSAASVRPPDCARSLDRRSARQRPASPDDRTSALRVVGFIGMAASCFVVFHAMLSNRFFSAVVRIQRDRGHRVIDGGPYRVVRHPGYAGMILAAPFSGLALGSWISVALALIYSD